MTARNISQAGEPAGTPFQLPPNYDWQRILVVDDDSDIRRLNTEVLVSSGYTADAAADGAVAWKILQINSYDLLLTDHDMPKVTGVELLKKLHAARMPLPVILAPGRIPMKELSRHPWLQIDATLLKPYTPDELLATVRKVLFARYGAAGRTVPPQDGKTQPLAAGMKISLQNCKTGQFMRCDSVWTASINEALNFHSVRQAISFGMKELKEPFRVLQIRKNDLLGSVIIVISDLPRLPQFSFKGQSTASAVSLNRLRSDGQTDSIPTQLELTLRHRILVVDDNMDTRQLSVDVLVGSGYEVDNVKDGAAGWEAFLAGNHYDLVVTDNKMPNMTGIEMIAKLRSACITVPIIMATEHLPTNEFARKPWLEPQATLQRPFSNDDLLKTVKKVLGGTKLT